MNIRSLLLISGLWVLSIPLAQAQKGWKAGLIGVPQAVFLYNADDLSLDEDIYRIEPLWGMSTGLNLGYNFNDYLGFRVNALYAQQGGAFSALRDFENRTTFVTRLNYVKLPLLLGFNTGPENRKVMFTMYGGAQLNLLTGANEYSSYPMLEAPLPDNVSEFPRTTDLYEPLTYSLVGEMGLDIQLPPDNFVLNLRLRADFSPVDAENKGATYRVTDNGTTSRVNYWDGVRGGITRRADTYAMSGGLLIGLTYTFSSAVAP
ncbi:MAG: PorT family protein [Bacteroidetes bacterium]|nr:MAG: PorT family protein [Bacteroidota bacterium]